MSLRLANVHWGLQLILMQFSSFGGKRRCFTLRVFSILIFFQVSIDGVG